MCYAALSFPRIDSSLFPLAHFPFDLITLIKAVGSEYGQHPDCSLSHLLF